MNIVLYSKPGGILGPVAALLGYIMDAIFIITSKFGIANIGLCIIIFTVVTRIILFPFSYKQAKSQKLMSVIQPEIAAIQKKYKGKEGDRQSMMFMQAEIKAVYERYGTSMAGGMLQLFIQLPILYALYKVIMNIPAYVSGVRVYFDAIVSSISGDAVARVNSFIANGGDEMAKVVSRARISGKVLTSKDQIVDFLYNLNPAQWEKFGKAFTDSADAIAKNYPVIEKMNSFFGINLASSPSSYGMTSIKFWIIPLLAGAAQFLSTKLTMQAQPGNGSAEADQAAAMTKSMSYVMPLVSVFFCFSFASGIGIYWIASSVIMGIQQFFLNKHMSRVDVDSLIDENLRKVNAKREKKGLPPVDRKTAEANLKKMNAKIEREEQKRLEKINSSKEEIEKSNQYYKTDSIADRARMVEQYNEKHLKK